MSPSSRPLRRLVVPATVAALVVGGALSQAAGGVDRSGDLVGGYDARVAAATARAADVAAEAAPHDHGDPSTKNALSRAGETTQQAQDPTSAVEKITNATAVAAARTSAPPTLATRPATMPRAEHPPTRYALANGCYTLTRGGEPRYFKPTALGRYLLYDADREFVTSGGEKAAEPGAGTIWTARLDGGRMTFSRGEERLAFEGATSFVLTRTDGCAAYPESQINISGDPFAGTSPYQEVRGYADAHTHGMAFEFLGGGAHCGKPWERYGAPYALVDCPDHSESGGYGAVLEAALSGRPSHDPVGWPTFKDWPAPDSLTHEGTYYRWLERSWRGGQRILVNLLVENNQLCTLYPLPAPTEKNSCDDMDSVRLQARDMYRMQDYIDAQMGGPGQGFYRIVRNPFEARKVINAGKMAVIMGIETSVPFGCTSNPAKPTCDLASIDRQLDEVHAMGVRQMELVNKFDNALSGVAGDSGEVGAAVNSANFAETGSYWDMRHCEPANPDAHDRNQIAAPEIDGEQQDAMFGAIASLGLPVATPVYPPPDHCNARGLTTLGEHTIKGLAERHMIFDPDHMSVSARQASLDQLEELQYPGVVSSHSWSTEDAYPRIYRLGGFIAPYAGDSTGFVEKWRTHLGWADRRFYFGLGYGADMNGLGAQGDPRGTDVPNPVTYPFQGLNGVTVRQQHAGERVYDINADGVAQYGLYPDWVQDLREVAGDDGDAIVEDMERGAEAYLQMWERAEGIRPDSCRNPELRPRVSQARDLVRPGQSTRAVMAAVGQPFTRNGRHYTFCARTTADPRVRMQVRFSDAGRVTEVRRLG